MLVDVWTDGLVNTRPGGHGPTPRSRARLGPERNPQQTEAPGNSNPLGMPGRILPIPADTDSR
jgi:hypothetical protein